MASLPFLNHPVRTKETETGYGDGFSFAVTTCQGWRRTQEDVHLVIPDFGEPKGTSLFAVFDGHNGIEVAEYVSHHLPNYILSNEKYQAGAVEEGLKEAFLAMDKALVKSSDAVSELRAIRSIRHPKLNLMVEPGVSSGCTAVVCLRHRDGNLYCANIGDSRAVLIRRSQPLALSRDHTPEVSEESKRIHAAGGSVVLGRINAVINVSRAFGDHIFKDNYDLPPTSQMIIALPEVTVVQFDQSTDRALILMCDGIWNSMPNDDVVKYVETKLDRGTSLASITEGIISDILSDKIELSHGIKGKDNMTILVVNFKEEYEWW